jgi:hypothetical protein
MGIFTRDKAINWIKEKIHPVLKNKKKSIIIILILISGCFFYDQFSGIFPKCFANDYNSEGSILKKREWVTGIYKTEAVYSKTKEENEKGYQIKNKIEFGNKQEQITEKTEEIQLHQMVGNAPIKEMVSSIIKLDRRVAAFVVGIAKKESDWGRHAPTQGGRNCYNYWGYKGSGSRGTSMGYACFGSPEEAVEIVGKRIEKLVAKNINEPRQMLVWKCGSSCASHDPAGVKKWVSDVNLYFGKVMQIKNS